MSVHLPLVSSLAHSTSVSSLVMWPFSGPQQAGVIKQATPTQLCQLPCSRAGWPTEICTKRGRLPGPASFQRSHQVESSSRYDKWTDHQVDTTPSCLGTTPLRRARCPAVLSTATVPAAASTVHHGTPDDQPRT